MQHGGPQFPLSVLKVSSPVLKQGSTVQSELSRTHYIAQASLPFTEGPLLEAEGSRRLLSPRYGTPPLNNGGPQHPTGLCQVQACLAASDSHMVFGQRSGPRSKLGGQGTPLKTFRLMQVFLFLMIYCGWEGGSTALAALAEDPGSIPSTHRWLTIPCDSRLGGPETLFWPPWAQKRHRPTDTDTKSPMKGWGPCDSRSWGRHMPMPAAATVEGSGIQA